MTSFSIIIPSYLGTYKGAATNREQKILRAINSALNQTYQDFEIIVVADGCQKTVDIVSKNYTSSQVRLIKIPKQPRFSGQRNFGIEAAKNDYIVYLDIDDLFDKDHLEIIAENVGDYDWVWFNDLSFDVKQDKFIEHGIQIDVSGKCGTANICHKRTLNARWINYDSYLHDWLFIQSLKKVSKNYRKIPTPGYCICHVPSLLNV